jgi:hypothetical protein
MPAPVLTTLPQTVTKGAGRATFEVLSDANGPLAVPQFIRVPELLDYDYQDKREVKTLSGGGARPIALISGKEEITISLTMAATFGKLLNQLCYGQKESANQHIFVSDDVGYTVPNSAFTDTAIRNCVMIHAGRWDSSTGVTINGTAATLVTGTPIAGQFSVLGGKYTFAKADLSKLFEITFISNGVTIVQTGRVPAKLSHDVRLYADNAPVTKRDATLMTRDTWSPKSAPPQSGHYQGSPNGVLLFAADSTVPTGKFMKVTHWTDGQKCTSSIAAAQWPAASYQFYVDPPSAAAYVADVSVAVVGGASLDVAIVPYAQLTAGKYRQDGSGWYQFHSSYEGDIVRISYQMDYYSIYPVCRNFRGEVIDGNFFRAGGVFNVMGKPLTRVAVSSPLSIALDQYALDETTGAHYLAYENAGDRLYIDAEFEAAGGSRIEVKQVAAGLAPVVRIVLNSHEPDQQLLLTFERAMCEGMGVKTKTDDAGDAFKFSFKCAVDRATGLSHAINTSS